MAPQPRGPLRRPQPLFAHTLPRRSKAPRYFGSGRAGRGCTSPSWSAWRTRPPGLRLRLRVPSCCRPGAPHVVAARREGSLGSALQAGAKAAGQAQSRRTGPHAYAAHPRHSPPTRDPRGPGRRSSLLPRLRGQPGPETPARRRPGLGSRSGGATCGAGLSKANFRKTCFHGLTVSGDMLPL